jgi:hypothetical protein
MYWAYLAETFALNLSKLSRKVTEWMNDALLAYISACVSAWLSNYDLNERGGFFAVVNYFWSWSWILTFIKFGSCVPKLFRWPDMDEFDYLLYSDRVLYVQSWCVFSKRICKVFKSKLIPMYAVQNWLFVQFKYRVSLRWTSTVFHLFNLPF